MPVVRRLPIAAALLIAAPYASAADVWQQIESPVFAEREAATDALWAQGKAVRERLAIEAERGGLDKRERCRRLLRLIDLGVPASVNKIAANAIVEYDYDAPDETKRRLIRLAASAAAAGSPALLKMGLDEPTPQCVQMMFASGSRASGPYLDSLIDAGDAGRAELWRFVEAYGALDNIGLISAIGVTLTDQAGDIAARIHTLRSRPKRNEAEDRALLNLLVLAGRSDEARTLAEDNAFGSPAMDRAATALALRTNDRRAVRDRVDRPAQDLAMRVAARVVAGDVAAANALLVDEINNNQSADLESRRRLARLCLLTGRIDDGVGYFAGLGEVGVMRAHGDWAQALVQKPPSNLDNTTRTRRELELEQLKDDTGERPTQRQPKTLITLTPELRAAAEAAKKNDSAGVVHATETLAPKDLAAQTAGLWIRAEHLDLLNRPADAKAARDAADLHALARQTGLAESLAKLDVLGLTDLGDRVAARLASRQADNAWLNAPLADRAYRAAARRQDWAAAQHAADDLVLWQTLGGLSYSEPVSYLRINHRRWTAAAHLALANGNTVKAIEAANTAVSYLPIDIAAPMAFCEKLRAADEPAAADALFDRVWAKQQTMIRQYPKAASLRNTAAWMALRCDRNVAEAVKLASEAVALRPDNDAFLDTLAEAQFRTGRKDQAVTTMRRAQRLQPNDSVILARLKGFEQGKLVVPAEVE